MLLLVNALRGFADRAGDGDAVEQLLRGADFAEPFVGARRQALAGGGAGAGVAVREFCGLIGLMAARRPGRLCRAPA